MNDFSSKLMRLIEDNISKGKYVQKNIEVSAATGDQYFVFQLRSDGGYSIFAKADVEMPKEIEIPSQFSNKPVVSIGKNAFSNSENRVIKNQKIESVTIPESIMNISDEAMKDCIRLLKVIIFGNRVPTLGKNVFLNTPKELAIYVPVGMVDVYKNDPSWSAYRDKIQAIDVPSPEETPNQEGLVNTVVTTVVDSKDVSISYNFYFLNITNSTVVNDDENYDVKNFDDIDQ
ncbi:leucine-rich repeat protein [Clostridium paridis]|uniref:Leucine-rich repeat protein n=1 Tax=Clostridium paridis TaxID=2803863 RepID=A0A937K518_9CLOT|nr:leucine-rich repeat protein [Clostridium paridis]MBL4933237.1 leucine-rich repeat protein [Clostridium paridis]